MIFRETCVAGSTIDFKILKHNIKHNKNKRNKKVNATPDDVAEINRRNAVVNLKRKINHNFIPGDWHLVLTYAGDEPTKRQAKKDRTNFLRRLKDAAKKQGKEFKYIIVTEFENKRIHHHIVCTDIGINLICDKWTNGQVRPSRLDKKRNYVKLAEYLIKETSKTFRNHDCPFKRRFSCSRNIVNPVVKRERIKKAPELNGNDPKALKGYYIDMDSISRYENKQTGLEQIEYTMISLDIPRYKKWPKGKPIKSSAKEIVLSESCQLRLV